MRVIVVPPCMTFCLILCLALLACSPGEVAATGPAGAPKTVAIAAADKARIAASLAPLPASVRAAVLARIDAARPRFLALLEAVERERRADPMRLARVDKEKVLSADYEPADLISLDESGLSVSRKGHRLRREVVDALLVMDQAARREGILLLVSSTYRSYSYQAEVFARNSKGSSAVEEAKLTARPGHSQHQLGSAIDFGSIDDSFAETKAGRWLAANAGRFGFSLSYPKGMSEVTGYSWESWHYRYVGKAAAALEVEFFGGVQQYLVRFLESWR